MTDPLDLDALEALATTAASGPWHDGCLNKHVPALIAEIRRLCAENADLRAKAADLKAIAANATSTRSDSCECGRGLRNMCNICDTYR